MLLYRDLFSFRCERSGDNSGLAISVAAADPARNPVDFTAQAMTGNLATHVLDVSFALGDLVDTLRLRAEAHGG